MWNVMRENIKFIQFISIFFFVTIIKKNENFVKKQPFQNLLYNKAFSLLYVIYIVYHYNCEY